MTGARVRTIAGLCGALAALMLLAAMPAGAQSITGLAAIKNAGNNPDEFQDGVTVGYERTSTVGVLSNDGIVARVRYQEIVGADTGLFSSRTETLNSDYNINFNVTAPGAYDLNITTSLNGAFTIAEDGNGIANADMGGVTGSQTGGTVSTGTLSLTDPGSRNSVGDTPFARSSSATISGTSNGSPVVHTLRFTWSATCVSDFNGVILSTGGDECAVRLGLPVTQYGGETAGDYPGPGGRVAANDGHFVTIALVSLCGDGVVQGSRGEQCDLGGGLNGTPGTCCSSSCQLLPNGASCRAAAGVCDIAETCDGSSPNCPADAKSTARLPRPAGICDVAEFCNGIGNNCPPDGFANLFTVCRPSAGVCDLQENCTGSGPNCPADAKRPNTFVCRGSAGVCDVAETCDGSSDACPADALEPNGTVCRAAAGVCDVAENCDGSNPSCPADAVEPATTDVPCDRRRLRPGRELRRHRHRMPAEPGSGRGSFVCRGSAGACDVTESCDGAGRTARPMRPARWHGLPRLRRGLRRDRDLRRREHRPAPPTRRAPRACRASAGVCDVAETCDGVNNACPADAFEPATTVCRPSTGTLRSARELHGLRGLLPGRHRPARYR